MDRKLLTAEKILGNADGLIRILQRGKHLRIVSSPGLRQESKPLSLEVLKKKYFLQKGILAATLNKPKDAQRAFLDCLQTGDSRIKGLRLECFKRLRDLQEKAGNMPMYMTLQEMIDEYRHRDKDIIFLVNEYTKESNDRSDPIQVKIARSLLYIFDNHVSAPVGRELDAHRECPGDRISLMSYGKNVRKLFNLVHIKKNRT